MKIIFFISLTLVQLSSAISFASTKIVCKNRYLTFQWDKEENGLYSFSLSKNGSGESLGIINKLNCIFSSVNSLVFKCDSARSGEGSSVFTSMEFNASHSIRSNAGASSEVYKKVYRFRVSFPGTQDKIGDYILDQVSFQEEDCDY